MDLNILGAIGAGMSAAGGIMMDRQKQDLAQKLEMEREERADARTRAKEERDEARRLATPVSENTEILTTPSGGLTRRLRNYKFDPVGPEVPVSEFEATELRNKQEKEKASLDKILAETAMLKEYGPQIKAAELQVKLGQAESYQTEADADRARTETYSLDYQAGRDASRAANRAPKTPPKASISKSVEDAYFSKEVTNEDGETKRVRDTDAVKSYNRYVVQNNLVKDDASVEAWAADQQLESDVRESMPGASAQSIEQALKAIRAGEDFNVAAPRASHPAPTAAAARKLWSDPEKHKARFIRDFGEAAYKEAMRRRGQ